MPPLLEHGFQQLLVGPMVLCIMYHTCVHASVSFWLAHWSCPAFVRVSAVFVAVFVCARRVSVECPGCQVWEGVWAGHGVTQTARLL